MGFNSGFKGLKRLYVDFFGRGFFFQPGLLSIIFITTGNGLGAISAPCLVGDYILPFSAKAETVWSFTSTTVIGGSWLIVSCVIYGQCVNPNGCLTLNEFAVWLWIIKWKEFDRIFCGTAYALCYRAFHYYVLDRSRIWACLTKANVMAVLFLSGLECVTVTCLCAVSHIAVVQYFWEMVSVKHSVHLQYFYKLCTILSMKVL